MKKANADIQIMEWKRAAELAKPVREAVFIQEQGVPPELELDELDAYALHVIAIVNGKVVGTGRLTKAGDHEGKLGRIAILPSHRRMGIGEQITQTLVESARERGLKKVSLTSQLHAVPLYEKCGFVVHDGIIMDAGIEHKKMTLDLV